MKHALHEIHLDNDGNLKQKRGPQKRRVHKNVNSVIDIDSPDSSDHDYQQDDDVVSSTEEESEGDDGMGEISHGEVQYF